VESDSDDTERTRLHGLLEESRKKLEESENERVTTLNKLEVLQVNQLKIFGNVKFWIRYGHDSTNLNYSQFFEGKKCFKFNQQKNTVIGSP